MNKTRKFSAYRAKSDAVKIDIGALCADVTIVPTESAKLYIEYTKNLFPHFAESDGIVTLRQIKGPFWKFKRPTVIVHVPECTVPDLRVDIVKGTVFVCGGIYNDAYVYGKELKAEISGATFENLQVKADELDVSADAITVKNLAGAHADGGRVEIDKAFCKKAECRVKKGNIGLCNSSCDFAVLNSEEGNIAASMLGNESDYTIELTGAAVSGNDNLSSSGKSIKARAARGSVVLDFANAPRYDEEFEKGYGEELHA